MSDHRFCGSKLIHQRVGGQSIYAAAVFVFPGGLIQIISRTQSELGLVVSQNTSELQKEPALDMGVGPAGKEAVNVGGAAGSIAGVFSQSEATIITLARGNEGETLHRTSLCVCCLSRGFNSEGDRVMSADRPTCTVSLLINTNLIFISSVM